MPTGDAHRAWEPGSLPSWIQFARHLPRFRDILFTCVEGKEAPVLRTEIVRMQHSRENGDSIPKWSS